MIRLNRATSGALGQFFLTMMLVLALCGSLSAAPMVYTGLVVTDVRVGKTLMHNAALKITFEGDTNDIIAAVAPGTQTQISSQECNGTGYFFYLKKGDARMEIEFQGRTQTARLQSGQIFVALDACNGGIGFGSFVGPGGLEPVYPFALTLGKAEYDAITDGSPLLGSLSTTGLAWSCIGYAPKGFDSLLGTSTGNCTPPDANPQRDALKSDIGDIFVYQPYYQYDCSGCTDIVSNHSGSTNRGLFLARPKASGTLESPSASEGAHGSRVVYTLQTVADGSIGTHVFNQALVTLQMISDPESVKSQPSPVDATRKLYENRGGRATVTVDDGGQVISAVFAPGEVYVRYDTGAGVAGFGSQISPTYPIALDCSSAAYPSEGNYTADCIQGEAWNYLNINDGYEAFHGGTLAQLNYPLYLSPAVQSLPQSLSQNTLLTGTTHTCAGVYDFSSADSSSNAYFFGDLGKCIWPAPRGLRTSRGEFFLQDLEGGTLSLGNVSIVLNGDTGANGGWDLANSGFLHVEVLRGDD